MGCGRESWVRCRVARLSVGVFGGKRERGEWYLMVIVRGRRKEREDCHREEEVEDAFGVGGKTEGE